MTWHRKFLPLRHSERLLGFWQPIHQRRVADITRCLEWHKMDYFPQHYLGKYATHSALCCLERFMVFDPKRPQWLRWLKFDPFITTEQRSQCAEQWASVDQDQRSKQPIFNHRPLTKPEGCVSACCAWEKWSVWQNAHSRYQRHLNKWANLTWKADDWPKSQCKISQAEPWVSSGPLPRMERCSHHLEPPLLSITVITAEYKGSLVTVGQQTLIVLCLTVVHHSRSNFQKKLPLPAPRWVSKRKPHCVAAWCIYTRGSTPVALSRRWHKHDTLFDLWPPLSTQSDSFTHF